MVMLEEFREAVNEIRERHPVMRDIVLADGATGSAEGLPPFVGLLLGTLDADDTGGVCAVLPGVGSLPFVLGTLAALERAQRDFKLVDLESLTATLQPGQRVCVDPEGWVYEFDGYFKQGRHRFLRLLVFGSVDRVSHFLPEEQAFRVRPTSAHRPVAPKKGRLSDWTPAQLDRLLDIRTGGNLALIPARVILLSTRSRTLQLAEEVSVGSRRAIMQPVPVAEAMPWGRITPKGRLVRDGGRDETPPIIAVSHSIELIASVCNAAEPGSKIVIIDGARRITNLQAFDTIVRSQRVLVLADYDDVREVEVLRERDCDVWLPSPQDILVDTDLTSCPRSSARWLEPTLRAARNALSLSLETRIVPGGKLAMVVELLQEAERRARGQEYEEDVTGVLARTYGLLVRICELYEVPGGSVLEGLLRAWEELQARSEELTLWVPSEVRDPIARALDLLLLALDGDQFAGLRKRQQLEVLLSESQGEKLLVVMRSPSGAERMRELIAASDPAISVCTIGSLPAEEIDTIILGTWCNRGMVDRMVNRFLAPRIVMIGYDFEEQWFRGYRSHRSRAINNLQASSTQVSRLTGISLWPQTSSAPQPTPMPSQVQSVEEDPITRVLSRRRKGGAADPVDSAERREARYVGFYGPGYAYLTEGHRLPVLTDLITNVTTEDKRISLRPVGDLSQGDFVLFRDGGDRDVITLLASATMGLEEYERIRGIAGRWRESLRSIGRYAPTVWARLQQAGLRRDLLTVRNWLNDDGLIGPGSRQDLQIIAIVSGDQELAERIDEIRAAMAVIRSAHVQAGARLSNLILEALPDKLAQMDEYGARVDLGLGSGTIVCVEQIAEELEERPYWEVNRLLLDESF
jgi:hypothetical protein